MPLPEFQLDMLSMTVKTTMRVADWSKDTVYDLIAAGEIKSFLMGSRRYIDAASVRDYIARRAAEPLTIRRSPQPRTGPRSGPATSANRTSLAKTSSLQGSSPSYSPRHRE
jgi:excisionase family DNA binding protein